MGERYLDLIEKLVSNEVTLHPQNRLICVLQQRFHNLAKGEISPPKGISPCEARFHPPKEDFTLPQAASYAPKGYFIEHPLATPGNCCCCD